MISLKVIIANNKVLKNFSVLTLSNATTQFLLIFTSIKIARSLDPTLFGTYNLLNLHVYIVSIIASLGLRNIIIRTIARDKKIIKKVFFIAIVIRGIGLLISIVLFCIYSFLNSHYDNLLFMLVLVCILST
jgi:O-antigen/teichoic acid export membrane protein